MMHLLVEDVEAWWRHVQAQGVVARYNVRGGSAGGQTVGNPGFCDNDPTGVCGASDRTSVSDPARSGRARIRRGPSFVSFGTKGFLWMAMIESVTPILRVGSLEARPPLLCCCERALFRNISQSRVPCLVADPCAAVPMIDDTSPLMHHRNLILIGALTALSFTLTAAQAFDESKYPDWKGQLVPRGASRWLAAVKRRSIRQAGRAGTASTPHARISGIGSSRA